MYASSKGASMQKLPLSVTIGPAFIFAIRKVASGDPNDHSKIRDSPSPRYDDTHRVYVSFEAV